MKAVLRTRSSTGFTVQHFMFAIHGALDWPHLVISISAQSQYGGRCNPMSLLTLHNVSKGFEGIRAVDDVSFTIDRGEVVGFLGPNGAGKSTTMRMVTQYLEPDNGSIALDGIELGAAPLEAKRRIGYLPENNPPLHGHAGRGLL